jgi:predicted  nucleic acid-binding Zn-ribbon protein
MKRLLVLLFSVCFLFGCSSAYYGAMEKIGIHKRDILVDRVEEARDSQLETKEQFASALEQFKSVLSFDGGELESKYRELNDVLEESEDQAEDVRDRIAAVENVAEALFDEWEAELDQYSSASLRRSSQQQLKQTQNHYGKLISAMKKAEAKIDPVLNPLRDQVLFLKHNLNARAIASLQSELGNIETDVSRLIRDMELAIAEADQFISALKEE